MSDTVFCCRRMERAVELPESPVTYDSRFREFAIRLLDEGPSYLQLIYCPWSGDKLPESLRERWFDELERRGIDPWGDAVPEKFSDDRWYTESSS